jgi:hypothetical protein
VPDKVMKLPSLDCSMLGYALCGYARRLVDRVKVGPNDAEDDEELMFPNADSRDSRLEWRRDEEVRSWRNQSAPKAFEIGSQVDTVSWRGKE